MYEQVLEEGNGVVGCLKFDRFGQRSRLASIYIHIVKD
jgi:hypothetical protein